MNVAICIHNIIYTYVKADLFFSLSRCGHCKKLAPEWKKASNNLKGKVKLGHVDCDADKVVNWFS